MTLTKNFLQKEPDFIKISRLKLISGILIGLAFSFVFYSFLYLIRESFRILSATEYYDLWILSDSENQFYNLMFAFISVIIAQSVTFTFWFDSPGRNSEIRNRRRTTILNDQRVLNWYFLSWFSKLSIVFGLMFGLAFDNGFYVFSFYPDYNYVLILIIIVLFLQTWSTLRSTFKRKSLKWMLSSALLLSFIAFGLSEINMIDYKVINQNYLKKNIQYNYNLELPETNCYEKLFRRSLIKNIYMVESESREVSSEPIIVVDNEKIAIEKVHEKILDWQLEGNEHEIPIWIYRLHIHKIIKMKFVNQLINELMESGVSSVVFAVIPAKHEYDKRYYQDFSFSIKLPNRCKSTEIYDGFYKTQNTIKIIQTESGCFINDSLILSNQIKYTIKKLIQQNPDYIINFSIDDNSCFSDYFRVLSDTKEVVNELRDEYSKKNYSKQYDSFDDEEEFEVSKKFPFQLFEFQERISAEIENE